MMRQGAFLGRGAGLSLRAINPAWLIIAALAVVLIVQVTRLLYTIVTPPGPVGDWQARGVVPLPPDAQRALFARFDPFFRQQAVAAQAGTTNVTALPLQLFGVRSNAATGGGSAIIAGEDGIQRSIGVGEEILAGVRLVGVAFDHVTIERAGVRELLYLDQDEAQANAGDTSGTTAPPAAGGTAPSGNATPDPAAIRSGISFTPRERGGRVTGIAVSAQGDGSVFATLGFRPGDVIRSVNGRAISSAGDIASFTSQLQPGARLSVEVERGAETASIAILLPNGRP